MLTDLSCKSTISAASLAGRTIKKFDRQGLYLEAKPNGKGFWYYKYRIHGKELKVSLGQYPTVSLAEARDRHYLAYKQVENGINPSKQRQEETAQAKYDATNTLSHWATFWLAHNRNNWSDDHYKTIKRRVEKDLLAGLGSTPIKEITRKRIIHELKKVEERGSLEVAHRCAGYAANIFQHAVNEEYLEKNVAVELTNSLLPKKRGYFPSMPLEELPNFLRKLDSKESTMNLDTYEATVGLMHTLLRTTEFIGLEHAEIFHAERKLVVPGKRMKRKRGCPIPQDHIVPLSKQMVELFLERKRRNDLFEPHMQSKYVFPSQKGPHKHISEGTINKALKKMGYRGVHTGHGFRALGMGIAKEKLGYHHDIINRQLAHVPNDELKRSYDRALYLPQRTEMMQRISDYIDSVSPNLSNNRVKSIKGLSSTYTLNSYHNGQGLATYLSPTHQRVNAQFLQNQTMQANS